MAAASLDYTSLFAKGAPAPQAPFKGFPPYHFIGGNNAPELIPVDGLADSAARVIRKHGRKLATYNMDTGPRGYLGLRQYLADKLARTRGVQTDPENILITSGSMQGIDLIDELLLEPGDTILVEQFTYGGALRSFKRCQAQMISIPLDDHGIKIDALEAILEELKEKGIHPKLIYTIPTVQNPTASVMPISRRHELLKLAKTYNIPIFEDECYADLLWAGDWPPALRAFDDANQVIHIGSFSKNLAPALRLGYVTADADIIGRLVACKSDGGTPALEQLIVADFFSEHFDSHLGKLRTVLERKRDALAQALEEQFGTSAEFTRANGGIFQWITLPENVDTSELAKAAAAEGVVINAGREWATNPEDGKNSLRICFAHPSETQLIEGVAKLATICHREFGVPARSGNVSR